MKQKPIQRGEVRLDGYRIMTMPRRGVEEYRGRDSMIAPYQPIMRLWHPLVRRLEAERAAYLKSIDWKPEIATRSIGGWRSGQIKNAVHDTGSLYPRHPATCRVCGETFFIVSNDQYWKSTTFICSDACLVKRRAELRAARRRKKADERGAMLSKRSCRWCGGPVNATRTSRVFCSVKCRVAMHRHQQASAPGGLREQTTNKGRSPKRAGARR
jgi:hypothetical protein